MKHPHFCDCEACLNGNRALGCSPARNQRPTGAERHPACGAAQSAETPSSFSSCFKLDSSLFTALSAASEHAQLSTVQALQSFRGVSA